LLALAVLFYFAGNQVVQAAQSLKYRTVTERLRTISRQYAAYKEEGRVLDYLRTCGHNITL
jgi:hypothetical protein